MLALKPAVASHPTLCVAVSRADDASSFFNHLEDDAAVDVAHNVGVIWPHDPTEKNRNSWALGVENILCCKGSRFCSTSIFNFLWDGGWKRLEYDGAMISRVQERSCHPTLTSGTWSSFIKKKTHTHKQQNKRWCVFSWSHWTVTVLITMTNLAYSTSGILSRTGLSSVTHQKKCIRDVCWQQKLSKPSKIWEKSPLSLKQFCQTWCGQMINFDNIVQFRVIFTKLKAFAYSTSHIR